MRRIEESSSSEMYTTDAYRLRIEALERAERILERQEAELAARENLLERAVAIGMQPSQEGWQQHVEDALSSLRSRSAVQDGGNIYSGGGVQKATAMLGEWEDLVAKLEKHASQWRRKDAEIATRERDLARREAALEQERQILLQESEHLANLRERLSSMRVTVEERTRELNLREAELLARNGKAVEGEDGCTTALIALQEREAKLKADRERCDCLLEALFELYSRLLLHV
ncbi:hypothetical protein TcG_06999 [Trypanosoma cruzi]|nr:hypothetical protein TcG_06999 [Trypanosoma cruzi]